MWSAIHKTVVDEAGSKKLRKEVLLRRSWSLVLGTIESQLMRELEEIVEANSEARVCMPSYDGLLLHHAVPFELGSVTDAWDRHCQGTYNYSFPVAVKDFTGDLPRWLLRNNE